MSYSRDRNLAKEVRGNAPNTKIIDIGCSKGKLEGAIGIDLRAHPHLDKSLTTDIIGNINDPFPIKSNSFDLILANNIIEHVKYTKLPNNHLRLHLSIESNPEY